MWYREWVKNFWDTLPRPIMALAPMADVTDAAFRRIIAKYSKISGVSHPEYLDVGHPNKMSDVGRQSFVMYTEFVSADGLARAPEEGRRKLLADLIYSESERPIVAQFFTSRPEHMEKAAALARELGFDGVDINMGCPDRSIEKQGAGAAHIKNPQLAQEIIYAAMQGAKGLPVSIKTRLGYNTDELEEWLPALLKTKPAAITIHARTRKEMSKVPARWERIRRAVELRNQCQPQGLTLIAEGDGTSHHQGQGQSLTKTLIIGNGDVADVEGARRKVEESGADGAMLGRAIFGNPWLFYASILQNTSIEERLRVMVEHTKLFEELFVHPASSGARKNVAIMKKHYKAYVKDFKGAAELRAQLMPANGAREVEQHVDNFLAGHQGDL